MHDLTFGGFAPFGLFISLSRKFLYSFSQPDIMSADTEVEQLGPTLFFELPRCKA